MSAEPDPPLGFVLALAVILVLVLVSILPFLTRT